MTGVEKTRFTFLCGPLRPLRLCVKNRRVFSPQSRKERKGALRMRSGGNEFAEQPNALCPADSTAARASVTLRHAHQRFHAAARALSLRAAVPDRCRARRETPAFA